ncbi:hypothetical protein D3C71_2169850 [compost metagenome]
MAGRVVERADPGVHHVVDEDEVAGLLAVSVDTDRLAADDVAQEDAQHALIGVIHRLPRSVDVVHAE